MIWSIEFENDLQTKIGSGTKRGSAGFPLKPIWHGFAINTLFYAAILWLLFAAPFALRRWRRNKRGLCIKCGYDLRGSPGDSQKCPECGAMKTPSP